MGSKLGKFLWNTMLFTAGTLAATTVIDRVLTEKEKEAFQPYGFKVQTPQGGMNVAIEGNQGPVIVLLSGYGTAAPILDFKPLSKELSRFAKVVTLEYLGYGCSDQIARSRTLQHIAEEIHEVMQRLNINQYYLMPHSISGVYALYYVNRYPEEVLGVFGIDTSIPSQIDYVDSEKENQVMTVVKKLGLLRVLDLISPGVLSPNNENYDEKDRYWLKRMSLWIDDNPALQDEGKRIKENFNACRSYHYPKDLPVLMFLSTQTSDMTKGWWEELHEKQIEGMTQARILKLEGKHYLHWSNSAVMAEEVKKFIRETSRA